MKRLFVLLFIVIAFFSVIFGYKYYKKRQNENKHSEAQTAEVKNEAAEEKKDRVRLLEIADGSTFAALMAGAGLDYGLAMEIYDAARSVYDLTKIKIGHQLELVYDKDFDEFKELNYKIDSEDELHVKKIAAACSQASASSTCTAEIVWKAEVKPIPYEVKIKIVEGKIDSSMYQAALDQNIDIRAIIALADVFQWTIDFAMDPKKGDAFKFVYEERYLDGEYAMPGKVLASKFVNEGKEYYAYYFEESKDNIGYFDENGNSAQKMFLKAPVSFKYISSGFTTGLRYIEVFNISTGHRAIDYAAAAGTPIRAVGDGAVVSAGWGGAYGNLTSIRHNSTYTTNYGHQSKILVKRGQKVKQGDIIGYVGSTGFSTGSHLHYEMVKNGVKINPLKEIQPPGQPIKAENKRRFAEAVNKYGEMLK